MECLLCELVQVAINDCVNTVGDIVLDEPVSMVSESVVLIGCKASSKVSDMISVRNRVVFLDSEVGALVSQRAKQVSIDSETNTANDKPVLVVNLSDMPIDIRERLSHVESLGNGYLASVREHRPAMNKDEIEYVSNLMAQLGYVCIRRNYIDHAFILFLQSI